MTTLSKELREKLSAEFEIIPFTLKTTKEDDETSKFLFKAKSGEVFEAVLLFHQHEVDGEQKLNRITLCISSQVGCAVGCVFCVTWKLWLLKNLDRTEILGQVVYANNFVKEKLWKKEDGTRRTVRNVVFMWMGEPLMNYKQVSKTFPYLTSPNYYWLSRKRVTVSTSGIYPGLEALIKENPPISFAFSIHAPNQELRAQLVPMGKFYKLGRLMEYMDEYTQKTGNKVFYEYVMIKDKNDMANIAHEAGELLKWKDAHLNLIPYNENLSIDLEESSPKTIRKFKSIVENYWVTVTIRQNMGRKEKSACWQLGFEAVQAQL